MKHKDLTHKIIGAAYTEYNALGFGFLESVIKKSMIVELQKSDLIVEHEKPLHVYYDEKLVGEYFVDLFVENETTVELKSINCIIK